MSNVTRVVAMSLIVSAGCGLVKLQTSSAGGVAGSSAGGGGGGDAILAAYKSFDYHRCGNDCGGVMRAQSGIALTDHLNPKSVIKNPAPEWITGWDKLPDAPDDAIAQMTVFGAMTLAASRSKWSGECTASYAQLDGELRAFDTQIQTKLVAAKALDGFYARADALAALAREVAASHPSKTGRHDYADALWLDVGARDAVEHALRAELSASPAPYAYHHLRLDPKAEFDTIRPRGSTAEESALFCAEAYAGHVEALPPPSTHGLRDMMAYVREPIAPDASARSKTLAADNRARNTADFGIERDDSFALRQVALPAGVAVFEGEIVKLDRTSRKLVLESKVSTTASENCKTDGRIARIRSDGVVERNQYCDMKDHVRITQTTIELAELPPAELLGLAIGHEVSVLGTEQSRKESKGAAGKRFGDGGGTLIAVTSQGTMIISEKIDGTAVVMLHAPATTHR
jgi:hypothetical protein